MSTWVLQGVYGGGEEEGEEEKERSSMNGSCTILILYLLPVLTSTAITVFTLLVEQ
jgi:hypothetical protein